MNSSSQSPQLAREIGLREATALNMIDMIGVGPFVTIPVIVIAMGGPQAMLGWVLGAFFAVCDGLVWAVLGARRVPAVPANRHYRKAFQAAVGWVIAAVLWVIFAGLTHFSAARAFTFPPGAFHLSHGLLIGLGSGMLVAYYDYWGYYNVC